MDRDNWSPQFRGRGHHPRNPRFRGDGNFGSPRGFSPHWHHQSPQGHRFQGSPYRHQHRSPYDHHSFVTSTPLQGTPGYGGHRPFFRGGRGRFNNRQSFGSPFDRNSSGGGDSIDNWISPEMWSDPWRHLIPGISDESECKSTSNTNTKFAESDFSLTDTSELEKTSPLETSNTKFAESDFSITDTSELERTPLEDNNPASALPEVSTSAEVN